jgi:hypothetical protein
VGGAAEATPFGASVRWLRGIRTDTTAAMTAAKQKLLELESRRHGAVQKALAGVQAKVEAAEGAVVETLDAARARKEARQAQPVWRAR